MARDLLNFSLSPLYSQYIDVDYFCFFVVAAVLYEINAHFDWSKLRSNILTHIHTYTCMQNH